MIGCIVFDFDGTLVLSNHIKRQAFYDVTHSHDPSGSTVSRILKQHPDKDRHGIFLEIVRELFAKNEIANHHNLEALAAQWTEAYTVYCEQAIATCEEVPGASDALEWISQQYIPICINSRTPTTTLVRLVTQRSFNRYTSEIYGAPATKSKNLGDILNRIQALPQDMLFVGDSEDDRQAAHEVGCHFVGIMLGHENRFTQPPEHQITDLYQLPTIVTTLHGKSCVA
ncbi:MAG: HAD family hydrolase [Nitrospirae bacterium]|nr:HAD family hydrolase [Nitrospirota bacterium]